MGFLLQKPDASPPAFLRTFATHAARRGSRRKQEEELSITTQMVSLSLLGKWKYGYIKEK